jgi:predicted AAA+ superfamily ATPase
VNLSEIRRSVALDHKTTDHYLRILEQLFLARRLQPWSRNEASRIVKTPKRLGPLLEGLIFSEILKLSSESEERVSLFHFRDRDQSEVDLVLENAKGQIVGIEVKAAASVTRRDFSGLDRLSSIAGKHFVQGIVLYDGEQPLSFADNLRATPFASAWA